MKRRNLKFSERKSTRRTACNTSKTYASLLRLCSKRTSFPSSTRTSSSAESTSSPCFRWADWETAKWFILKFWRKIQLIQCFTLWKTDRNELFAKNLVILCKFEIYPIFSNLCFSERPPTDEGVVRAAEGPRNWRRPETRSGLLPQGVHHAQQLSALQWTPEQGQFLQGSHFFFEKIQTFYRVRHYPSFTLEIFYSHFGSRIWKICEW